MDVSDSRQSLSSTLFNPSDTLTNTQTDKPSLDSTYEPDVMPDFDPTLPLRGSRLKQQPIFNEDSTLIQPWKAPFVLRKGALVAVEAELSIYHFLADEKCNHVRSSTKYASVIH